MARHALAYGRVDTSSGWYKDEGEVGDVGDNMVAFAMDTCVSCDVFFVCVEVFACFWFVVWMGGLLVGGVCGEGIEAGCMFLDAKSLIRTVKMQTETCRLDNKSRIGIGKHTT